MKTNALLELTDCFLRKRTATNLDDHATGVVEVEHNIFLNIRDISVAQFDHQHRLSFLFLANVGILNSQHDYLLWKTMVNTIIREYNKRLGLGPSSRLEVHRFGGRPYMTYGNEFIIASPGKWVDYPFKRGINPTVSTEIKNLLQDMGLDFLPRIDRDINYLGRCAEDNAMLSFIPNDRLKYFDQTIALDQQKELIKKYTLTGKPVKILKKAYYMSEVQQEKFLAAFRVPELNFVVEPPEKIAEIYLTDNYMNSHTLGNSCMRKAYRAKGEKKFF
jgi:hypothetical protein